MKTMQRKKKKLQVQVTLTSMLRSAFRSREPVVGLTHTDRNESICFRKGTLMVASLSMQNSCAFFQQASM